MHLHFSSILDGNSLGALLGKLLVMLNGTKLG